MEITNELRKYLLGMDPYVLVQIKGVRPDEGLDLDIAYGGGLTETDLPGFFAALSESMPHSEEE